MDKYKIKRSKYSLFSSYFPHYQCKTLNQLISKAATKIKTKLHYLIDIKNQKHVVLHIKNLIYKRDKTDIENNQPEIGDKVYLHGNLCNIDVKRLRNTESGIIGIQWQRLQCIKLNLKWIIFQ